MCVAVEGQSLSSFLPLLSLYPIFAALFFLVVLAIITSAFIWSPVTPF